MSPGGKIQILQIHSLDSTLTHTRKSKKKCKSPGLGGGHAEKSLLGGVETCIRTSEYLLILSF